MNIIFDLDGTLLDSRMRLYQLFQKLVPESRFDFDDYWERKRNRFSHKQILVEEIGVDEERFAAFVSQWMEQIEAPEFLALDTAIPDIAATLTALRRWAKLYVCTARQDRAAASEQLKRLALNDYFVDLLVTEQLVSKESLIERHVPDLGEGDWMVGDTGRDVQVGKALGINTCAVLSGFLNRTILSEYYPDLILESANQLPPAILKASPCNRKPN